MNIDWLISLALRGDRGSLSLAIGAACVVSLLLASRSLTRRAQRLAPPEVQEKLDAGLDLQVVDVRSRASFAESHVRGSISVPLADLRVALADPSSGLPGDRDRLLVVIGDAIEQAERAAARLRRAGYTRVRVVDGGMRSWCADRLPLEGGSGIVAAGAHH